FIKSYPKEMITIHLPYYTLVWVLSMWFNGSYSNPFNFSKMMRSILIGTVVIFMIYGLLPNHLHFSRGIIIFGSLVIAAVLLFWRTCFHFAKYKTLDFSQRNNTKSILVGEAKQWQKVNELLKSYNKSYQQLGFVSNEKQNDPNWLGEINQLKELVSIYGVNEIIFSGDCISSEQTMQWMNEIGPQVNYYTLPANSDFVIGSHSKDGNGLYFGEQIELNLSKREFRTKKRLFDIALAVISIVLSPILYFIPPSKIWVKNAFSVLLGKKSWVGYSTNQDLTLPKIKPGVYKTSYMLKGNNNQFEQNLDKLYAQNYSPILDLQAMLSS
ncbi:MAG: hypothetical protein KJP21_08730, partial [Bacteroidia bacterium]|nr:hypothetical protein [Bacteroidia bacterium]